MATAAAITRNIHQGNGSGFEFVELGGATRTLTDWLPTIFPLASETQTLNTKVPEWVRESNQDMLYESIGHLEIG
jgi:hypothetical protein